MLMKKFINVRELLNQEGSSDIAVFCFSANSCNHIIFYTRAHESAMSTNIFTIFVISSFFIA